MDVAVVVMLFCLARLSCLASIGSLHCRHTSFIAGAHVPDGHLRGLEAVCRRRRTEGRPPMMVLVNSTAACCSARVKVGPQASKMTDKAHDAHALHVHVCSQQMCSLSLPAVLFCSYRFCSPAVLFCSYRFCSPQHERSRMFQCLHSMQPDRCLMRRCFPRNAAPRYHDCYRKNTNSEAKIIE
jgi:hypothetical protein